MRLLLAILVLTVTAHAQGTAALAAQAYYISASGSDSNNGLTSGAAWATAHHSVNCADILYASSGTYAASNFQQGKWGTVNCGGNGGHLARVHCATFDGCKISANNTYGIYVDQSYWEIDGWEVNTTANAGCPGTPSTCGFTAFAAAPNSGTPTNIHHIVFANDICNGAGGGCFSAFNQGTHSVDYVGFVGDIAYNGGLNSLNCYSGMTIYQPLASDSVAGTHLFVGGNFIYATTDPSGCASGANNGANGYIGDTHDGSQGLGTQFCQQEYVFSNLIVGNGQQGLQEQAYTTNPACSQTVYWRNNTIWGNLTSPFYSSNLCVEMLVNEAYGIRADHNIAQASVSSACTSHATYAGYAFNTSDGVHYSVTSTIANNWLYGPASITGTFNNESPTPNTFAFGTNSAGGTPVSAAFTAPAVPGAPSCGSATSTVNCMATVIANFVPTASGTTGFGYQAVSLTNGSDAQFPKYLCGNIPQGIVTMSC